MTDVVETPAQEAQLSEEALPMPEEAVEEGVEGEGEGGAEEEVEELPSSLKLLGAEQTALNGAYVIVGEKNNQPVWGKKNWEKPPVREEGAEEEEEVEKPPPAFTIEYLSAEESQAEGLLAEGEENALWVLRGAGDSAALFTKAGDLEGEFVGEGAPAATYVSDLELLEFDPYAPKMALPIEGLAVDVDFEDKFPPKGMTALEVSNTSAKNWNMKWGEFIGESLNHAFVDRAIIEDEVSRMGVSSDFFKANKVLKKYVGDQLLLVKIDKTQNPMGANYLWCSQPDTFDKYSEKLGEKKGAIEAEYQTALEAYLEEQKLAQAIEENGGEEPEPDLSFIDTTYVDKPLVAGPYEDTLGVGLEVEALRVSNLRRLIGFYISQERRKFKERCQFTDYEVEKPVGYAQAKRQMEDYEVSLMEVDYGFQCSTQSTDRAAQTEWRMKFNKATQYMPITYTPSLKKRIMASEKMADFLRRALPEMELSLEQNETLDLFKGEFAQFDDQEYSLGNKKENNLKPWHTFTDLTYSKDRIISAIGWQRPGVVAFSCTNKLSFDEWVEMSGKVLTSSILVWDFHDLLHPQYILMAPGDLLTFSINPKNPNLIVGGMMTGQVVLWDLTELRQKEKLKGKNDNKDQAGAITVDPKYISLIDRSHSRGVTAIRWLPTTTQLKKKGEYFEQVDQTYPQQFVTVAGDGHLLFWDSNPHLFKNPTRVAKEEAEGTIDWMYHWWIPLTRSDTTGSLCATKISAAEGTNLVVVTEDGEVAVVDWAAKSKEEKKDHVGRVLKGHVSACTAVEQSPHFPNFFLTVGDWTFIIWQLDDDPKSQKPVFKSSPSEDKLTCGCWSPTRPGLILVSRADGLIEVWDLLDQCHKPSLTFPSGSGNIASMHIWQDPTGREQYLALGDDDGKLHVIEIPRTLRRPIPTTQDETNTIRRFYDREIKRGEYADKRDSIRQKEKKGDHEGEETDASKQLREDALKKEEEEAEEEYQKALEVWKQKVIPPNEEA